jgi:phosphatidylserine decarboxylase
MNNKKKISIAIIIFLIVAIFPFGDNKPIKYIERSTGEIKTEKVVGEFWLQWLYNNPVGELSLYAIVRRKFISDWYGKKMDSKESAEKIEDFVKQYNINLDETKKHEFNSFNDFFTRELKPNARKIDTNKQVIISPSDGKIMAYQNIENQDFIIKGYKFNIYDFLNDSSLAKKYKNGALVILRLCPTDYHRFHFPVDGIVEESKKIDGTLYSVSPIALREKTEIICRNKREYTRIKTIDFGDIILSEVGATMVGSIVNTYKTKTVLKAQEKGYFKFGGSTIVIVFEKDKIKIDEDLLKNSLKVLETEVKMGERIGIKKII